MSNMLEQAIIDAAALRETAMKNAEATLIEKYNKEFTDTLEKLLEQEEVTPPEEPQEMSPETAAANAENPTAPTMTDPALSAGPTPDTTAKSKAFEKVKSAFFDLDGDDNELVTINFDGLKTKPADMGGSMMLTPPPAPMMENVNLDEEVELDLDEAYDMNGGNSSYGGHSSGVDDLDEEIDDESGQSIDESDELDEEIELELEESSPAVSSASPGLRQDAARDKQKAAEKETKAAILDAEASKKQADSSDKKSGDEIELTEEELSELEEQLRVDMTNESEGYMGSHKKKAREFEKVAYAAARDSKNAKKREEEQQILNDLKESNIRLQSKLKDTDKLNSDLLKAIHSLKEQVQKINTSNAKLLYTNKVLSNDSLNERQKNNIVENIARASSVSEAKTIYETLQSTVQSVKESSTPKSLSEALGRKQTPFLVRKEPASYNDVLAERMKALAGIKKVN